MQQKVQFYIIFGHRFRMYHINRTYHELYLIKITYDDMDVQYIQQYHDMIVKRIFMCGRCKVTFHFIGKHKQWINMEIVTLFLCNRYFVKIIVIEPTKYEYFSVLLGGYKELVIMLFTKKYYSHANAIHELHGKNVMYTERFKRRVSRRFDARMFRQLSKAINTQLIKSS